MSNTIDLAELQKDLLKIAEEEARKKPDIRKDQLKKRIREQILPSETIVKILPSQVISTIEAAIDAVVEMAVTMARLRIHQPALKVSGRVKGARKGARKAAVKRVEVEGKRAAGKRGKRGKRGKPLAAHAEDIMKAKNVNQIKVVDLKPEVLKLKEYKGREKKIYTLITIALNQSKKFEKVGPGEYKLNKNAK